LLAGLVKDKRHASRVVTSLTGEVA